MEEVWKLWKKGYSVIIGKYHNIVMEYPDIYISNLGKIQGRKTSLDSKGYLHFRYRGKTYLLHQVVAQLFIPNPYNKKYIDHLNTIRTDNRVENLKWCTPKENNNNSITIQNLSNAKLGNKNSAKSVICTETGEIFQCAEDAARKYNLPRCSISCAANPNHNQKKAGGYHWSYYEHLQ